MNTITVILRWALVAIVESALICVTWNCAFSELYTFSFVNAVGLLFLSRLVIKRDLIRSNILPDKDAREENIDKNKTIHTIRK